MDLTLLIAQCAPDIAPTTAHAVVMVESAGNPLAIGVVGARLVRQPRSSAEAVATAAALQAAGWNYDVGLAQINRKNFERLGLTAATALEPCTNLRAMQAILSRCYARARRASDEQHALRQALSCYYSGNFTTGFAHGYVQRVVNAAHSKPDLRVATP